MIESVHADYTKCPDCEKSFWESPDSEDRWHKHRWARHQPDGGTTWAEYQIVRKLDHLTEIVNKLMMVQGIALD